MNQYIFSNVSEKSNDKVVIIAQNYHEALAELCLKGEPYNNWYYLERVKADISVSFAHQPFVIPQPIHRTN